MSSSGEFHFTLLERIDRHGEKYLFAGMKLLNAVIFIRRDIKVEGRPQRWKAVMKPYEKPEGGEDDINWHDHD